MFPRPSFGRATLIGGAIVAVAAAAGVWLFLLRAPNDPRGRREVHPLAVTPRTRTFVPSPASLGQTVSVTFDVASSVDAAHLEVNGFLVELGDVEKDSITSLAVVTATGVTTFTLSDPSLADLISRNVIPNRNGFALSVMGPGRWRVDGGKPITALHISGTFASAGVRKAIKVSGYMYAMNAESPPTKLEYTGDGSVSGDVVEGPAQRP